jgi:hypothetical protein
MARSNRYEPGPDFDIMRSYAMSSLRGPKKIRQSKYICTYCYGWSEHEKYTLTDVFENIIPALVYKDDCVKLK